MSNTKKPLEGVSAELRSQLIAKPGNRYIFQNKAVDLREINDAQATTLANHPACMFLVWKDPKKRPEGQKGALHTAQAEEPAAKAPTGAPK